MNNVSDQQPLRLLIVALNYAPEMVGCAKYTSELAEELVARGHQIEVVTAPPYYPQWKIAPGFSGGRWSREIRAGVVVHRTPLYVPARPSGVRRIVHLASFGAASAISAAAVARRFKPHVVLSVAPTLLAAGSGLLAAKVAGAESWLHLQDFEVDAAFELGLLRSGLARRVALKAEEALLHAFDQVSTISPAMVGMLRSKGLPAEKVFQLRNWVDVEATPVFGSSNTGYRQELNISADDVVALYSGNMAGKQGIEVLAEVAVRLRTIQAPVTMLLCGEGPARAAVETACEGLQNVRFLPLQPLSRLPELLGTADIHLLPQRPEAADLVLPSKLTGMLASGRPVIAMAESGTGLAQEVEGCGLVVEPDAQSMTNAILSLVGDPELRIKMGEAGRRRAETRWRKSEIIGALEEKLRKALSSYA